MEKIRILHVLGDLGTGGIESFIMSVYRNIDRTKIQFDFLIHNIKNKDHYEEIKKLGGRVFKIEKLNPINPLKYKRFLDDFFESHKEYKILHCHFRGTESTILKAAKKHNLITISHSHSIKMGSGIKGAIRSYLKRYVNKYSDHKFACSTDAGKFLFGDNNFTVIKNGIDLENYVYDPKVRKKIRSDYNLNNNYVLVSVGRLSEVKNQSFLISLIPQLKKELTNIKLLIIGEGPLENSLKKEAKELNVSKEVEFLGSITNVDDVLQACDLFLMPSFNEGLPVSAVEAQASGLKCLISTNVPREVKLTENVVFLDLDDKKSWINYILKYKTYERENMYEEINSKGFNIKTTIFDLIKVYNINIVGGSNGL